MSNQSIRKILLSHNNFLPIFSYYLKPHIVSGIRNKLSNIIPRMIRADAVQFILSQLIVTAYHSIKFDLLLNPRIKMRLIISLLEKTL